MSLGETVSAKLVKVTEATLDALFKRVDDIRKTSECADVRKWISTMEEENPHLAERLRALIIKLPAPAERNAAYCAAVLAYEALRRQTATHRIHI